MQYTSGPDSVSTTTSAAHAAILLSPRSFHAATTRRAVTSYSIAARACANASRRPLHSRQRRTGHAVGAPHRSQSGGPIRRSFDRQQSQTCGPGCAQARQR